jgi:hypothetical protein
MWIVSLRRWAPIRPYGPRLYLQVQSSGRSGHCPVAFNERSPRVAVRRYIKGNLSAALACFDDGGNEPAVAREKKYVRALRQRYMIPGNGPGGFRVDFKE